MTFVSIVGSYVFILLTHQKNSWVSFGSGTIVFLDESGITQRPHRSRTWAPKGQTPILQYSYNWDLLSVIPGLTWWNF